MNGSNETHTAYIYGAKAAKAQRQLQIDFPKDASPVKKAASAPSSSPVKDELKKSVESPAKKAATPLKLKLRGARKAAAAKAASVSVPPPVVVKSTAPVPSVASSSSTKVVEGSTFSSPTKKKGSALLAKIQSEDYGFWVNNTGVIGGDTAGKRPQRTRKQVELINVKE